MESPNLVDLQIHQQIAHLKPRVKKLEELSHVFDKTIDGLIAKQQMYVDRLNELADSLQKTVERLTRIELQTEREAGKREFLGRIFNSKPFFYASIMLVLLLTKGHDSVLEAIINKVL